MRPEAARGDDSPPTSSDQSREPGRGPRGSLTGPAALGRSRYCSSLRTPGPPRRPGAWPVQGQGSERGGGARLYCYPKKAALNIATVRERGSCPGPRRFPVPQRPPPHAASRGAVVLSQPRPHSSEGASTSRPDYISQHSARPCARAGRVAPPERSEGRVPRKPREISGRGACREVKSPRRRCFLGDPRTQKGDSFPAVTKMRSRCAKTTDL